MNVFCKFFLGIQIAKYYSSSPPQQFPSWVLFIQASSVICRLSGGLIMSATLHHSQGLPSSSNPLPSQAGQMYPQVAISTYIFFSVSVCISIFVLSIPISIVRFGNALRNFSCPTFVVAVFHKNSFFNELQAESTSNVLSVIEVL